MVFPAALGRIGATHAVGMVRHSLSPARKLGMLEARREQGGIYAPEVTTNYIVVTLVCSSCYAFVPRLSVRNNHAPVECHARLFSVTVNARVTKAVIAGHCSGRMRGTTANHGFAVAEHTSLLNVCP